MQIIVCLYLFCNIAPIYAVQEQPKRVAPQNATLKKSQGLGQKLFLTIEINSTSLQGIFYAEHYADGRLILVEDAWKQANLNFIGRKLAMSHGQFGYDLSMLKGMNYELDTSSQSIRISAPSHSFGTTKITPVANPKQAMNASPLGMYINYNLNATATRAFAGGDRYNAFVEGIVFNHYGAFVSSMFQRKSDASDNGRTETVRAETYFQKDMPLGMQKIIIGDTISSAGAWSRPIRYAGISWSTDFSLKTGFISSAAPVINGSAALPSTIDIFINNRKTQTNSVDAGPFEISDFPSVSGAGQISIVVKDFLGVETISTQGFYSTPRLLSTNLHEFSIETGMERTNYGAESNSYERPFIAGTYRRGFDGYTLEGRAEVQAFRQAAGLEVSGVIKQYMLMYFALAASSVNSRTGLHGIWGIERSSQKINLNLKVEKYEREYLEIGASPDAIRPRQKVLAGLGVKVHQNLWLNVNAISQTSWNADEFNLISASLSIPMSNNIRINTFASTQFGHRSNYSIGINIVVPLSNARNVVITTNQDTRGSINSTLQVNRAIINSNGIGYQLRISDNPAQRVSASVSANTSINETNLDVDESHIGASYRLRTSGSLGVLSGFPFASRKIGHGSFAVIKVAEQANVDVYQSNRKVTSTDENGLALLSNLLPYQKNKISIEANTLPFDLEVNETSRFITPFARSGMFITLDIKNSNNRLVQLLNVDGSIIPRGSNVHIMPSKMDFLVGKRGEVYLTGLSEDNSMFVSFEGGSCTADLNAPTDSTDKTSTIVVVCS